MMNLRATLDPDWAWEPFVATDERPWNEALAAHLLRRAGFGGNPRELQDAIHSAPGDVIRQLAGEEDDSDPFQVESEHLAQTILATGNPQELSAWWVYTMMRTPRPLLEKATLFWHGHFATSAEKVQDAEAMYHQNRTLRRYALSDFSALVHEISRDPAMLIYLDSVTNRKSHPNENYAREVMELFCLGEGAYSEKDVQQLARCFTGWEIRRGRFRFNRYQHDDGIKVILGKSGSFPNAEAVDVVLDQPAAPRFIVSKLFQFFVCDEPEPSAELIEPLARELREHDWNIGHVIQRILGSNLFFSPHAVGRKVRSPVNMMVGLMRALEGSTNASQLAQDLAELGQGLFYPPSVKGWDGGRTWINSSTLLGRANVIGRLVRDEKTRFAGANLGDYFKQQGATAADDVVDLLSRLLLAVPIPDAARRDLVELCKNAPEDRIATTIHAMSMLPEFQLG